MQIHGLVTAAILTALCVVSSRGFAEDEPPKVEKPAVKEGDADKAPAQEKKDAEKKDAEKEESSLLDRLTKELLKEVDQKPAKSAAAEKENKLDRAAKGMRTAGEKLDGDQTGSDTRKIQEQVIKDLDDLINQLQNPPPPPQGGGGGGSGGGSSSSAGKSGQSTMQKMGPGQSSRSQQQGQAQGAGAEKKASREEKAGGQDKKNAEGSSERTESERKASEEAARKKKLEMDVWGHLPPHLRDQLLNTYGERMLPKYQQLVKQFYEALSEQGSTPPRR